MLIDLSSLKSKITEHDIFEYYFGEEIIYNVAKYRNPMRLDNNGTCYFYLGKNDRVYFIDPARSRDYNFDCWKYIGWKYNLTFSQVLQKVNDDLKLNADEYDGTVNINNIPLKINSFEFSNMISKKKNKSSSVYQVENRSYNIDDISYWKQFDIDLEILNYFKIIPVDRFKKQNKNNSLFKIKYYYKKEDPCYAYKFNRNGKDYFKLYRPFNKYSKWEGNLNETFVFGYDFLPDKGDILFITSGMKDLMCMKKMGFNSIAFQSETVKPIEDVMNELKTRFKRIYFLYDRDITGLKYSITYSIKFNCKVIILPNIISIDKSVKDIADYVNLIGIDRTKEMINLLIKKKNYGRKYKRRILFTRDSFTNRSKKKRSRNILSPFGSIRQNDRVTFFSH